MRPAADARGAREGSARLDRQREKLPLPSGIPHGGAQPLISQIVGAQRIAMHHQHPFPVQSQDHGIGEERRAAHAAEMLREKEVPIAVHDEARHA